MAQTNFTAADMYPKATPVAKPAAPAVKKAAPKKVEPVVAAPVVKEAPVVEEAPVAVEEAPVDSE